MRVFYNFKIISLVKKNILFAVQCRYQSGFVPPSDIPFEDLSKMDPDSSNHSQYHSATNVNNHMTHRGTIGANKLKKRTGIFGIFSSNKVKHRSKF